MDIVSSEDSATGGFLDAISGVVGANWTAANTPILDNLTNDKNKALDSIVATIVKKNYLSRFVKSHYQVGVENPQAAKAMPTMTLVCQNCQSIVNLPPVDSCWYCVAENVKRLVLHVPDNKYSYATKEMARKAFVISVATKEAHVISSSEHAVTYDPVVQGDGFLYP
ncbi:hypothetical protein VNI00_016979 [Paramarasmius palmivorus]|uniref:Uncharacterized protein n=1 Tax=Paramarasmius palmivorus TaxID=297713 RepID=A0AAW0BAN2_9AGAR